ncbi:unnamed protein product [Cylindrotheca closterium]|uniref:Uncharacterized protein n=1 Tax=Cylindrotheca closterium TaxID=2856 RepID=A0AAD2CM25_9STRA|nr:unnamed protein product [Cylindrotheca closterium]
MRNLVFSLTLVACVLESALCFVPKTLGSSKGIQSEGREDSQGHGNRRTTDEKNRRSFVKAIVSAIVPQFLCVQRSEAGEVGARITNAVTTSDLGITFRRAVVRGAQTMDRVDGSWEKFSDRYNLGAARSKADSRPTPKVIPELQALDTMTAKRILYVCDQVFSSITGIASSTLADRIQRIANAIKISFQRSGVEIDANSPLTLSNAAQYNFVMYAHFKAYSEFILEKNISFPAFRQAFEGVLGQELLILFIPEYVSQINDEKLSSKDKLKLATNALGAWCKKFQEKGLLAAYEIGTIDDDDISDWIDGISDLQFNLALDGDATMNSQILLQEQGYRLYPNIARFAAAAIMSQVDRRQKVSTMDYYFDTDYSSDPDKFEVKEVLVSVSIDYIQ